MLRLGMFGGCFRSSWTFVFSLSQTTSKPVRPCGTCLLGVGVTAFEAEAAPAEGVPLGRAWRVRRGVEAVAPESVAP